MDASLITSWTVLHRSNDRLYTLSRLSSPTTSNLKPKVFVILQATFYFLWPGSCCRRPFWCSRCTHQDAHAPTAKNAVRAFHKLYTQGAQNPSGISPLSHMYAQSAVEGISVCFENLVNMHCSHLQADACSGVQPNMILQYKGKSCSLQRANI